MIINFLFNSSLYSFKVDAIKTISHQATKKQKSSSRNQNCAWLSNGVSISLQLYNKQALIISIAHEMTPVEKQ